jgi:hypothetical protein
MALRPDLPANRINFTVAHEICHTFFYQRVPEIKFANHVCDPDEERLCNLGAEELLMPGSDVKKRAKDQEVSLRTLESLAAHYRVSLEAMFIRLRTLKMWDAELSLWHKMTNGTFAVKRIWGAQRVDWKWLDESIPNRALAASPDAISSGQDFWLQHSPDGPRFKPVSYQVGRHRGDLIVLLIRKKTRSISRPWCK